ncbi:MAG: 30S ribosomal protein S16 [Alphaproteobacteria bacterium]|nr:30S ribosomal protein S16 [Alphaproteobacteria bacterium]
MSTKIRLSRGGTKKRPYYSIVVTASRNPRDCKHLEKIGTYNPLLADSAEKRVSINEERAKYWLSVGAQMSDRVHLFFNKAGIVATKPLQRPARKAKKDKGGDAAPAEAAAA